MVTGPSLLQAAVEELYSRPMAEFVARRTALAAAARKAGDRPAAAQIAGLRKPTLSADTLNRLVRTAPEEVDELLKLGADLRAAEKALDASALRELSAKRRALVNDLTQLAFDITDQAAPSASVRDELTATLNAALADEAVAERLTSGAMVTQARWDGFGSASLPELATLLPLRPRRPPPAGRQPAAQLPPAQPSPVKEPPAKRPAARQARPSATAPAASTPAANTGQENTPEENDSAKNDREASAAESQRAAARSRAARERTERMEAAHREAAEADAAAKAAAQALADIDRRISELSIQLAHERQLLTRAQQDVRAAETRRRASLLALTRAGGTWSQ